jgi:Na+/proline symporter/signal transduction histidine kinase/ActR/RegA family two-component response regulator
MGFYPSNTKGKKMGLAWVALACIYLAGLFWLARWGDSHHATAKKLTSHPAIYSLTLAIYCTAWTFFGSVGEATRNNWNYLPILLGPILLYLFGYRFLLKLTRVSKKQHITTIADFISSRYGKRQTVALSVTLIALLASIPYIALQLKAIGSAFSLVSGQSNPITVVLLASIFIGLFSIYFGTQRTDVTEYRRGLMLAISFESIIKLGALIIVAWVGYLGWNEHNQGMILASFITTDALSTFHSGAFLTQTLMAGAAVICLPRQFHVAVVDNLSLSHLKTARWLFPLYLALIAMVIPIISVAGQAIFGISDGSPQPDNYVVALAILSDSMALQILVFVGGLSATTAMIIVATLTLSTMLTNDVILPRLLAHRTQQKNNTDYTKIILMIRRLVIALVLMLAYLYQQQMTNSRSLASIGLVAFSLVIQLLPAIVGGLYWKRGHAHGVYAGLILGLGVWLLWLILPLINDSTIQSLQNAIISEGAIYSLAANILAYIVFSYFSQPRLIDRIQAEAFVTSIDARGEHYDKPGLSTSVRDLVTLLSTFLGESRCQRLIEQYQQHQRTRLKLDEPPRKDFVIFSERALGGVIGASSAKVLVDSALSGKSLNFEEVVNFFDDTTQAIKFNISALFTSLESLEQGISVVDKQLNLVAWNKSYLDLFNYPQNMITLGTPVETLVRYNAQRGECGVGEIEDLVQRRLEHMRSGTTHRFLRQRSDGRVIEMVGNPLPGGGFVTSFNDVTSHIESQQALKEANIDLEKRVQKRSQEVQTINAELHQEIARRAAAEQEMNNARKAAEQANASKTRFLALASHDILQPLNAAKLYLCALNETDLPAPVESIVNKLNDSVNASEILIATLLDIARLDQGEMNPCSEAHSLLTILSPLLEDFSMKANNKGLSLRSRLLNVWVMTDRTYLHRIMQNLLSNAVKYSQTGKILLSTRKRGEQLLIQVRDTGMGIKADQQDKIFNDFYRIDNHHQQGVGLGLSIVMRLSQQLGNPVKVVSQDGKGSCFSIMVPLCAAAEKPVSKATNNHSRLQGLRVLCIDDLHENLDALGTLLDKWSVGAEHASNWQQALHKAQQQLPQVLLVDYHLGHEANGLELIKAIRQQRGENIPAVLITANQEESIIHQCSRFGVAYLSKPIKPAKLRALLQSMQQEKIAPII